MRLAFVAGPSTPLLERIVPELLRTFERLGQELVDQPRNTTLDAILTTARYGEPLAWRDSVLFGGRRRLGVRGKPAVYTVVHLRPAELAALCSRLEQALASDAPRRADLDYPGLAPLGHEVLWEQGRRGGPLMSVARLLQAQSKSLRVLAAVGDERLESLVHFDLAGAYPRSEGPTEGAILEDAVLRISTALSTREITEHIVVEPPVPVAQWRGLASRAVMLAVSRQLGERRFFTKMVRIADLVDVPAITDSIASQYSEGCFATWEPALGAMLATVSGSRHPVDKGCIGEDDLAVVVGVAPGGGGAVVRTVAGLRNTPPSSEAVEFRDLDECLPAIELGPGFGSESGCRVPVVRSKLHGHRGVRAYDPSRVEFLPLDEPYYHYLVSCSTEAQAHGVKGAFARSVALRDPSDPRQIAFTVLPGHGLLMVEKWVPGTRPFEVLLAAMDTGALEVENRVPQGVMRYERRGDRAVLEAVS